jgi:hypothetical protein
MMNWFQAGGFGMFVILAIGAGAIGYGLKALGKPTEARVAALRALPGLIALCSIHAFGTGMWAVNQHLSDEAWVKRAGIAASDLAFTALLGVTEASQALTLGGFLAMIVVALRMAAEAKLPKSAS